MIMQVVTEPGHNVMERY